MWIGDQKHARQHRLDHDVHHGGHDIPPKGQRHRPGDRAHGRCEAQPFPQPQAGEAVSGEDHKGEIANKRPEVGLARLHQERARQGCDEPESSEGGPMQGGRQHGEHGNGTEQHEGERRPDQTVEGVGGISGRKSGRRTGCSQHARHMGLSQAGQDRGSVAAAQPFPCAKQGEGESGPECDAGTGPEQTLLDRVAHEKEPAQRQGEAPNPNGPTRAEPFVPARRSWGRNGNGRNGARRLGWGDRRLRLDLLRAIRFGGRGLF